MVGSACADGTDPALPDTDGFVDTDGIVYELPALCINEYMSSNTASLVLEDTTTPDWIEVHNPTDDDVSLEGWFISDDATEPNKHTLTSDLLVPAGGQLILYADADPEEGPDHLSFNLSKDGEQIVLSGPGDTREVISYGPMASDFSFARSTDCCDTENCWIAVSGGTPGATNAP
jgi:hypothetical protein